MSLETWLQREERKAQGVAWIDGPAPAGTYPLTMTDPLGMYGTAERDPSGLSLSVPGAKADAGKVLGGLLLDFAHALELVAEVGTHGVAKYSRGGWRSVPDGQQRYLDAAMRHLLRLGKGEQNDADSGLPHLAHIAWNFLAVLDLQQRWLAHGD